MGEGSDYMRDCENCVWQQSCKEEKKLCSKHTTMSERMTQLHMTLQEYERFSKEWDETRWRIRRKCGIKEKRYV